MFYIHRHLVADGNVDTDPNEAELHLTEGVIHQVDVMFQAGCLHNIHVQIWQANRQVWPTNTGESLTGDGTIISFREFFPISAGKKLITIKSWGPAEPLDKYIEVHLGLLPKKIIQPLSFEELLAAAAGID